MSEMKDMDGLDCEGIGGRSRFHQHTKRWRQETKRNSTKPNTAAVNSSLDKSTSQSHGAIDTITAAAVQIHRQSHSLPADYRYLLRMAVFRGFLARYQFSVPVRRLSELESCVSSWRQCVFEQV
jgi:hypothetical protein